MRAIIKYCDEKKNIYLLNHTCRPIIRHHRMSSSKKHRAHCVNNGHFTYICGSFQASIKLVDFTFHSNIAKWDAKLTSTSHTHTPASKLTLGQRWQWLD